MINSLQQRRSARVAPAQAAPRSRLGDIPDHRAGAMRSTTDTTDELALKLLEAEVAGLRQLLAEVTANRDELRQEIGGLRRDRDHWQKLAEKARPTPPAAAGQRSWFCGRASAGA
jgi:hypothetical protein